MKARLIFAVLIATAGIGLCLYLCGVAYAKYANYWQLKQETIAAEQFHKNQGVYEELLGAWTEIAPQRCGKSAATSGFVNFVSITRGHNDALNLSLNDNNFSNISIDESAKKLSSRSEAVRSVTDTLGRLGATEILQSGYELKIISPANDAHGILHVDQSCPDAANIAFWSQQPGNFKPENPGEFIGLKSLGDGWYYYVEQR